MADSIDGEQPDRVGFVPQSGGPELPRLMLITLAPLSAAYRIATATSSSLPPWNGALPKITSQKPPSAFTGISLTLNATPARPMPSLVSCPMVPLTCVPCPSRSSGGLMPREIASYGATMRPALPPPTSCGAAEYGIVWTPSAGYRTPRKMKLGMFAVIVALRYARPVSITATVTVDPACG